MSGHIPWARARHRRHARPELQETNVTTSTLAAALPQPDLRVMPQHEPAPAPEPPFAFTILGGDLGQAFDAAMARMHLEVSAALQEERDGFAASSERIHARLDIFQRGEDMALSTAARTGIAVPLEPLPVAEPEREPQFPSDEAIDQHVTAVVALHDEQDAAEGKDGSEGEEPAPLPDVPGPEGARGPADGQAVAVTGLASGAPSGQPGTNDPGGSLTGPGTPDGEAGPVLDETPASGPAVVAPSTAAGPAPEPTPNADPADGTDEQ